MADNNYIRIAGRRFQNQETGEIISRRQYDKLYGNLAKTLTKSYEELAKRNRDQQGSAVLLKPARNRQSSLKAPLENQQEIIQERKKLLSEKRADEKLQKAITKKVRYNKDLSLRNFKPGKRSQGGSGLGRDFKLPFDYVTISEFLNQAKKFPHAFGYIVGFDYYDVETQQYLNKKISSLRDFSIPFKFELFEEMMEIVESNTQGSVKIGKKFMNGRKQLIKSGELKNDIIPLNATVYIALKMESAKKHAAKHSKKF